MGQTIQVRRGVEANLPTLNNGELALTTDTKDIYVGTPTGNERIGGKSISSQLADIAKGKSRNCSQLGMIPNSSTEAVNNFHKLIDGLNKGYNIEVDNAYYVQINLDPIEIQKYIILNGVTDNAKLIFVNHGYNYKMLSTKSVSLVRVENVQFENQGQHCVVFSDLNKSTFTDKFSITGCSFSGNFAAFRGSSDPAINPSTTKLGFGDFIFSKNKVTTTTETFILIQDIPLVNSCVNENDVDNFYFVFFYAGVTNGSTYEKESFNARKYIEFRNNHVYNDDSYWNPSGTYHCFALYEGIEVVYKDNHVEGLHGNVGTTAIYDAYLSCTKLTSVNNKWINNINFNNTKTYADLFKSKEGQTRVERIYRNNYYKLDKAYAERLGQSLAGFWVTLCKFEGMASNFIIEGNEIDVYNLILNNTSWDVENYEFKNNKIISEIINGYLHFQQVNSSANYTNKATIIKGNTVMAASTNQSTSTGIYKFADNVSKSVRYPNVIIEDNHFEIPFAYFINDLFCDKLTVRNNYVKNLQTVTTYIAYIGEKKIQTCNDVVYNGNEIISKGYLYDPMFVLGDTEVKQEDTYRRIGGEDLVGGLFLAKTNAVAKTRRYKCEYEIISDLNYYKFSFTFLYGYDATASSNFVEFTDTTGVLRRATISADVTGNFNNTDAQITNEKDVGIRVNFMNASGYCRFVLKAIPTTKDVSFRLRKLSFEQ